MKGHQIFVSQGHHVREKKRMGVWIQRQVQSYWVKYITVTPVVQEGIRFPAASDRNNTNCISYYPLSLCKHRALAAPTAKLIILRRGLFMASSQVAAKMTWIGRRSTSQPHLKSSKMVLPRRDARTTSTWSIKAYEIILDARKSEPAASSWLPTARYKTKAFSQIHKKRVLNVIRRGRLFEAAR